MTGGDSGSLLVQDVSTNPRAIGLLFAGNSIYAFANPISQVLASLAPAWWESKIALANLRSRNIRLHACAHFLQCSFRKMQSCRIFWRRFGVCLVVFLLALFFACGQNMAQGSSPSPKRDINVVLAAHDKELLAIPGVVGVYVGTLEDRRTPCLRVMVARKTAESRKVPQSIEGYPIVIEVTGEIRALDKP